MAYTLTFSPTLEDDEIAAILVKADELAAWAADVKEFALQQALQLQCAQGIQHHLRVSFC